MCKCIPVVQSIHHNIYTYVHIFTCMQNLIAPHTHPIQEIHSDTQWYIYIYIHVAASNQSPALVFPRWSSSPDLNCYQMWNVRDDPGQWISVGGMGLPFVQELNPRSSLHRLLLLYSCSKAGAPSFQLYHAPLIHCLRTGSMSLRYPICGHTEIHML